MRDNNRKLIRLAFEAAGITFLATDDTTDVASGEVHAYVAKPDE